MFVPMIFKTELCGWGKGEQNVICNGDGYTDVDDGDDKEIMLLTHMIFVKKNYATAVLEARILRQKRANRNISQFATKERKFFKMAFFAPKEREPHILRKSSTQVANLAWIFITYFA